MFRRKRQQSDFNAEIEAHLELEAERLQGLGWSVEEARMAARREFGNLTRAREEFYESGRWLGGDRLLEDLRFSLRMLRRSPTFTASAVFILALSIGANAAVFSLIDALMLHALPVQKPEELAQIRYYSQGSTDTSRPFSNPVWEQVRDHQDVFSGAFAWSPQEFDLADGGEARIVHGIFASGAYFPTLGVQPALGRVFSAGDDVRGCSGAAVLGYGFWQQHYGRAENAIGSELPVNGHPFPVIGVAQKGFFGTDVGDRFDVALPLCAEAVVAGKNSMLGQLDWWLLMMGRLKPGISPAQAAAHLNVRAPQIFGACVRKNWSTAERQANREKKFAVVAAPTGLTGYSDLRSQYRQPLEVVMVVVLLVFLIGCANVASLLLARSTARQREMSIRLTVGASCGRLIRLVLTESFVLSGVGALLGVLFARWSGGLLIRLVSTAQNPIALDLPMDGRLLAFEAGIAITACLLFGVLPALCSTQVSLAAAMKGGEVEPAPGRPQFRAGRWVVAIQIGLSLVLLVAAGLFVSTFKNLVTLDPGFDRKNVLLVTMNLHQSAIPPSGRSGFYGQVLSGLASAPGVISAGQTWFTPFSGGEWYQNIQIAGSKLPARVDASVWFNGISPGYFAALRTPLLGGRSFNSEDTATSSSVAMVNESFARRFFPASNPVGRYIRSADSNLSSPRPLEIVGVVKDSKYESLREAAHPFVYVPLTQMAEPPEETSYVVRIGVEPSVITPVITSTIARQDKAASIRYAKMSQLVDDSLATERTLAALSGFFGILALLLTAIGLYGVMAYFVTRRTHEIGIRVALGAGQGSIVKLVAHDMAALLIAGIVGGTVTALSLTRLVRHLLFGLNPNNPYTLLLAIGVVLAVAVLASWLPTRRATKVDPMVALRYE